MAYSIGGDGETFARPLRLLQRLVPVATELSDRGPMHEALTGERDHAALAIAPLRQRGRPLVGAPQLGDLLTGLDHRAVHRPSGWCGHLTGDDRDHRLIQCGQTLAHAALAEQGPALDVERQRHHVGVAEPAPEVGGPSSRLPPTGVVTDDGRLLERPREQEIAVRGALLAEVLDDPAGPGEPALGLPEVAIVDQVEAQPEGTAHRVAHVATFDVQLVGPLQRTDAVADVAHQVCGCGQQLQIGRPHRRRRVGLRQRGVRLRPLRTPAASRPRASAAPSVSEDCSSMSLNPALDEQDRSDPAGRGAGHIVDLAARTSANDPDSTTSTRTC